LVGFNSSSLCVSGSRRTNKIEEANLEEYGRRSKGFSVDGTEEWESPPFVARTTTFRYMLKRGTEWTVAHYSVLMSPELMLIVSAHAPIYAYGSDRIQFDSLVRSLRLD